MDNSRSDFSDRFISAYNKYTFVASATIFICVLELSEENRFFGFLVSNVSERWIETFFFVSTIVLAWNYITRLLDERRVFYLVDDALKETLEKIKLNVSEFKELTQEVDVRLDRHQESVYNYTELIDSSVLKELLVQVRTKLKNDVIEKLQPDQILKLNKTGEIIREPSMEDILASIRRIIVVDEAKESSGSVKDGSELKEMGPEDYVSKFLEPLQSEVNDLFSRSRLAMKNVSEMRNTVKNIQYRTTDVLSFVGWAQIRYWTIDILVPLVLIFVVGWSYTHPNEVMLIVDAFGEISTLNKTGK